MNPVKNIIIIIIIIIIIMITTDMYNSENA